MKKPLIIIAGPTAVGKTAFSIKLAKALDGEIISADSMQVYKGMDIGTAKIKKEEMCGIPHFLIDEWEPDEEFNVTVFQQKAKEAIDDILSRGKIPIITGGTGFYIQSVLYDIDFSEEDNDYEYRHKLEKLAIEKGGHYLYEMLRRADEASAQAIHENNIKKVIRALEYYHLTGKKISEHNEQQRSKESPYQFIYFVLTMDRETLYHRIDFRVDSMIKEGLLREVKALKEKGYHRNLVSMQGLGYKEILAYLEGEITLEEAVYIIKRETRHFAKRQLTWFKREKTVTWINKDDFRDESEILHYAKEYIAKEMEK